MGQYDNPPTTISQELFIVKLWEKIKMAKRETGNHFRISSSATRRLNKAKLKNEAYTLNCLNTFLLFLQINGGGWESFYE